MKKIFRIIRFYFRYKITWRDLDFSQRRRLLFFSRFNKNYARKMVFCRTFNNVVFSKDCPPFRFIGFTPWFRSDAGFTYSAQSNEVD
jgi:hypothetical protein